MRIRNISAAVVAAVLALPGCSSGSSTATADVLATSATGAVGRTSAAPEASATNATPQDPTSDRSLAKHILSGGDLEGFTMSGDIEFQDPASFATEHKQPLSEVEESGLLAAAFASFGGTAEGTEATSVATLYATDDEATAEAQRLFTSNSEAEEGVTARLVDVPTIPGAKAVELKGDDDGEESIAVEVVFVTGAILHEIFVFGPADAIHVDLVIAAARALFDRLSTAETPPASRLPG